MLKAKEIKKMGVGEQFGPPPQRGRSPKQGRSNSLLWLLRA